MSYETHKFLLKVVNKLYVPNNTKPKELGQAVVQELANNVISLLKMS